MKINKSNFGWLFACIGLFILLAISIYLGVRGFFFKTQNSYTTDLKLGQTIEGGLNKNQATSMSLNFSGDFLPGEKLPQIVSVKNSSNEDLFVRAKVFIYNSQNQTQEINVIENSNWSKQEDGYFYLTDLISKEQKVNFCSHIIASEDFVTLSWKKYIVTFVFETLDSESDVISLWGINPIEII